MDYSANIPRGKVSMSREFPVPFRSRSSSHTPQCNCSSPDNTRMLSSPPMAARDSHTPSSNSKDPKQAPPGPYFGRVFETNTEDDQSSNSSCSEDEIRDRKLPKGKGPEDSNDSAAPGEPRGSAKHATDVPTSNYPKLFAYGLIGMTIDFNGDILDSSKMSCGKASGDITEMIGQKIDEDGLIRSTAGEVVGQVAQNYGLEEAVAAMMEAQKRTMGEGNGSRENGRSNNGNKSNGANASQEKSQELPNIWQGTVGEGAPANDIHLNVQSTKEGISMSIRIPTMFMKEQHRQFEEEKQQRTEPN